MARINFSQTASLPDAADQVSFDFLLGAVPGVASSEDLRISCLNAQIPGSSTEAYSVTLHGHTRNFSGRAMNSGTLSITFSEIANHGVQKKLLAWKEQTRGTESGNSQGYLADYSILAYLISYDTTGKAVARRRIEECFIQDIPDIGHDGSSSAAMQIPATFKFARSFMEEVPIL